ncbi:NEDD8-activating enzyme E1 regulatory subunit [Irineochytrium annulatum]|nr:NEDD8-activating enzyme E1 regulatory subunit [Irineochytrium annulatum]
MADKTQKYDRQLRLWQAWGQAALEASKVCLINGTATGTEILKNLVLPGIGSFTIVDGNKVAGADVGNNFFLDPESIGKNRAERTALFLKELNDDVKGFHLDQVSDVTSFNRSLHASNCRKDPVTLINTRPDFFHKFTVVITTSLPEAPLLTLGKICWEKKIPLVVVRTYGMVGYLRVSHTDEACTVVETHPEQVMDLRLDRPFDELKTFAESINMEKLGSMEHSHVPYPVILMQCLKTWKDSHNGELPKSGDERSQFKGLIQSKRREGNPDSENFDEAIASVFRACTKFTMPGELQRIFSDPSCENITAESTNFWVIARAVRDFVNKEGEGLLPLSGVVPDMKSDTDTYVQLQSIYRRKAREDYNHVKTHVSALLSSVNRPQDSIPSDEIERFCKNAAHLRLLRYRSLEEEHATSPRTQEVGRTLEDPDSNMIFYVCLRGIDAFWATHRRYPGDHKNDVELDVGLLRKSVSGVLGKMGLSTSVVPDDYIQEMVRAGNAELHTMAAIMGGVVSQEVIKIITHQYVPMNNTLVYNGFKSTTSTFVL